MREEKEGGGAQRGGEREIEEEGRGGKGGRG